jgi:uncharacterized protein YdhG (YjbR/CyaY superfamily)
MAETGFKSVDEYIASPPESVQGVLERVRSAIRKAGPGAEEVIRFPLSQPVPVKLIERIAKFRAKEVTERQKLKL